MPRFDKPTREEVLAKYEKDYMERLAADGKIELTEKMSAELAENAITFDDYEKDYLTRLESKKNEPSESIEDTQIEFKPDNSPGAMPKGWNPPAQTNTVNVEKTVEKTVEKVDQDIDDLKKELAQLTAELESEKKELDSIKPERKPTVKKTRKKTTKTKRKPTVKKTRKKTTKTKRKPTLKKTRKKRR